METDVKRGAAPPMMTSECVRLMLYSQDVKKALRLSLCRTHNENLCFVRCLSSDPVALSPNFLCDPLASSPCFPRYDMTTVIDFSGDPFCLVDDLNGRIF